MDALFFHPRVVHVPIALSLVLPLFSAGVLLAWWRGWLPARTWVLVAALQTVLVVGAALATQSGEAEAERVAQVVDVQHIEAHEQAAQRFMAGAFGVWVLMVLVVLSPSDRPKLPLAAAATLGTFVVLVLAYFVGDAGGSLVYRHGAAQVYLPESARAPVSAPSEALQPAGPQDSASHVDSDAD